MIARGLAVACLALVLALPAAAEGPTLADMRAELSGVRSELQSLRAELVASGAAGFQAAGGDAAIDRMNAMEQRLAQLTDRIEQLQNRINRVVESSTRRMDDLEFRLCEMDQTCDLSALTGSPGQGTVTPDLAPVPPPGQGSGKAATAAEQADFDAARQVLASGDFRRAADLFGRVAEMHAGGPLTAEALFLRGAALDSAGEPRAAAAAWLEGFAADPDGPRAGESLLGIARVIADQGDSTAACLYLAEIPARFPGSAAAGEAETRLSRLACGANDLGMNDPGFLPDESGLAEQE